MKTDAPVAVVGATGAAFGFMARGRLELLTSLLLATVTFAAFLPALDAGFLAWDDDISSNEHIHALNRENFYWMLADTGQAMRYKPLSWLSWAILYAFANNTPWPYHVANLVLHCTNTVLIFLLIRKLFEKGLVLGLEKMGVSGPVFCSAIGALLWGLHPLRTEPVAWVTGLPYAQSVLFALLSLLWYLDASGPRKRIFLCASWISFSCALFTYPLVLGYPAVLLVLDFYLLNRLNSKSWSSAEVRGVWLEKLPFVAIAILFVGIAIYSRFVTPGVWEAPVSIDNFGLMSRAMQAFYIWAYYVWKPWVPFNLSPVYTTLVSFRPSDWIFLASATFILMATPALFLLQKRCRLLFGLWLCHLALLVPVLGLTEHPHYASDRYGYLASICWSILIAAGLGKAWAWEKQRGLIAGAALALGVVLGAMSFRQTQIWQNNIVFFEHMLEKLGDDPYREDIYPRLAKAYLAKGEKEKALQSYLRQLELNQNNAGTHDAVGTLLFGLGKQTEAKSHLMESVRLSPERASAHVNLGIVLQAENKTSEAVSHYQEALRLDPLNPNAHHSLGIVLALGNKLEEAILHFTEAIKGDPENPGLHYNLALARSQKARRDEGRLPMPEERALQTRPDRK